MKLKEILKQKRTGNTWGYLIHVIGQLGMVTQIVMLMINVITLATVLQMRGINIPTWLIMVLAFGVIFCAGIIVFKVGLPSFFGAWNQQWYEHNNPMRKDIEELKTDNQEIKKSLNILTNASSRELSRSRAEELVPLNNCSGRVYEADEREDIIRYVLLGAEVQKDIMMNL